MEIENRQTGGLTMANKKRLIDANGSYTLNATDNTGYILCFSGGIIGVMDIRGRCVCEFFSDDAPTVDAVEVVHGYWIDNGGLDEDGNGQYRCSQCGAGEKHYPTVPVSYCWNCGAKMDGDINYD